MEHLADLELEDLMAILAYLVEEADFKKEDVIGGITTITMTVWSPATALIEWLMAIRIQFAWLISKADASATLPRQHALCSAYLPLKIAAGVVGHTIPVQ